MTPIYFNWFQEDFTSHAHGSNQASMDVISWIGTQLSAANFNAVLKTISGKGGGKVELKYQSFDWEFSYRFPPAGAPSEGYTTPGNLTSPLKLA